MANTSKLRKWFSDKSIRIFFGARSQDEINQVVDLMEGMTPAEVERFKAVLGDVAGDAIRGK
jgi:hypothetical protein